MNYARTLHPLIIPALLLLASVFLHRTANGDDLVEKVVGFGWGYLPIIMVLTHRIFAMMVKDTTKHDRLHNVRADLKFIRRACVVVGGVSTAVYWYLLFKSTGPIFESVWYAAKDTHSNLTYTYLGAMIWLIFLFGDLKKAKMIKQSWGILLCCLIGSVVFIGPGATLIAGWLWREEILAGKRHWRTVVKARS